MNTKVKHAIDYNDKIVIAGKLKLVETDIPNSILVNGKGGFGATHKPYDSYKEDVRGYLPIIIFNGGEASNHEEILPENMVLHNAGWIAKCVKRDGIYVYHKTEAGVEGNNYYYNYEKILAMPENISPELIKKIVDGVLRDKDVFLVECDNVLSKPIVKQDIKDKDYCMNQGLIDREWEEYNKNFKVKLNSENKVNIIMSDRAIAENEFWKLYGRDSEEDDEVMGYEKSAFIQGFLKKCELIGNNG